jgi:hypothetical protein
MATVLFEDPELPKPDRHGRFPALAYARISLARDKIMRVIESEKRGKKRIP